jgi:hypothetical protein
MLSVYGVDVLDPAVSTRRVAVLLDRLPPYALRPGEPWSTEADLLALLIDQVAALTWITMKAHGAKNAPRPRPVPRPRGAQYARNAEVAPEAGEAGKAGSWADAAAMLGAMPGVQVISDG